MQIWKHVATKILQTQIAICLNITLQQYLQDPDIYVAPHTTMKYHQSAKPPALHFHSLFQCPYLHIINWYGDRI